VNETMPPYLRFKVSSSVRSVVAQDLSQMHVMLLTAERAKR
jgi:hypothetical protein